MKINPHHFAFTLKIQKKIGRFKAGRIISKNLNYGTKQNLRFSLKMQGGQNVRIVRIFFYVDQQILRLVRNVRIVRIVRIFILEIHRVFLIFTHFSKFFM